ncbi:DNA-binding CsgD family transcriptional regulator [Hoeflea marina]|uniref:DNA-binding CsgD family transcriptional regulator n=1 Tax=Hoeflea marina TaxID=274592 RepID=A0A317PS65_9HYPH|nr:helix-turn-helix domain-containing protein [Hoeflea marina]PWW04009.1 DNA-binding CsgD family transcriptional regulator [Hoeflea marina]
MMDATLPMGEELQRALNRMDFFRLFRGLSVEHEFDSYGLVEVSGEVGDFSYAVAAHLQSWTDARLNEFDARNAAREDPLIVHLHTSIVPKTFRHEEMQGHPSGLMDGGDNRCAVVIPLHTPAVKRFGLILLGNRPAPNAPVLAGIALEAALIFQRYYDVILSLETITGLTDSEIQIVRWTAEGKTANEIATNMGRSAHTINSYMAAVLRKLQVANRAQMVATAIRSGLIN